MSSILDRQGERFAADASDRRAFEALEEAAFVAGDWDELVGLLQQRLEARDLEADFRERARVLFRIGQAEDRRGQPQAALVHWHAAVTADPGCRAALEELRRDATIRGRWDVALQIADAELALEMASNERATLQAEVGALWLEHFDAAEQALPHFEAALDALPGLDAALEGAALACESLGRNDDAGAYWGRVAETRRGADRARALVAQAALLARQAEGRERSTELYRRALSDDPENTDALDALADIAERDERWPLACDLLERRFATELDATRRAQIALRAGRHHFIRLGSAGIAHAWLERAVEADPTLLDAWQLMADVQRETGDDPGLLRALRELARRGEQPASLSTLIELAALESGADDESAAAEHLRTALALAPDDALVIEALTDSLARLGEWQELTDCLERQAAIATSDPATCAAAFAELASVQEARLSDIDAARRSYERALQAEPAHREAVSALQRIYRKAEDWQPLRTLLEHVGRSGARDTRPAHLCALGDLLVDAFDDTTGATAAYDEALELDHTSAAAHRGRQRLAQRSGDPTALLNAYENEAEVTTDRSRLRFLMGELTTLCLESERPDAALHWTERWIESAPDDLEALERAVALHRELDHDAELVAALERVDPLLQSSEQAELRCSLGRLHRGHERDELAIAAFRAALVADPRHEASLEALIEVLGGAGHPEELARAHRSLADLTSGERRVRSLDALARLLEQRLGDLPQAIDALEQLVEEPGAPGDVEDRLEVLLESTARHEELAQRLALRAESGDDDERRSLTLRRAAILLEHLSEFDAAVTTYRGLLEADPSCEAARHGLGRSLRASGDPRALAEFLAEQATQHEDPAARSACAFERAVILDEVLEASDEAADILHGLALNAAESDTRRRASERLEALLERADDYEALRAHLEQWIRRTDEDADRAALHDRLGQMCLHRLADSETAAEHLEAAAAIEPQCSERWHTLARLYEEEDRPRDLARALEGQLNSEPGMDAARELALRARVAGLCATRLSESDRARDHYERVLEIDPGDSTAGEFLIDYWDANARPDQVARLLELRLGALDAQPRDSAGLWAAHRTSLRLRVAGLRANELDDPDGAIAVLEPALGEIGPQAAVAEPLADLYKRAGYGEDLIDLCGQAADACDPGFERASWLTRLGDALRAREREAEAITAYERALDERPGDAAIEATLRELYRNLDAPEPLARLLEAELTRLGGPAEIPVRLELAKLWMQALDRPEDALLELRRVLHLDPSHAEALDKGLELAERLDQPSLVRELLDDALRREHTAFARADLVTRRARLLSSLADSDDAALSDYREAVSLDPDRRETRTELRELLESRGDWSAALECLCEEAYRASAEERVEQFERGAALAWEHVSPDAALAWLARLRHELPQRADLLARIAEAHRLGSRPHAQLRALEAEIEMSPEPARRQALLCECARVFERDLGWSTRAIAAYEQARETAPNDASVLRELDRLYAETGRDRERARILEALVPSAAPTDRAGLLRDAAALHRGRLADPREAARLLLRATAETRNAGVIHGELLRELADALRAAGPPDAWARCAEAELAALDPDAEVFAERRLRLRHDLAAYYQRSGCLDAAIRHLTALVDGAPPEFDRNAAHETSLLHALRCQGNIVELERRTTQRLERTGGDSDAWLALARLRDEQLSATAQAAEAYQRAVALAADPTEAVRGLRSAAVRLSRWDDVAGTLELELEHNDSLPPAARAALLRNLGDVCWEQLGSTTRASRAYAGAIEAWPEDLAAQRSLRRLLEAMEDWRGALDLYESEIDVLGNREPERRMAAWLGAGELARDRTGEPRRALRAYVAAAELGELAPARRREHAELHHECGEAEAFAEIFASWCDDPQANADGADHLRLAETLETLGRHDDALARCERALEAGATDAHTWATAARLREACGALADASAAWEQAAEATTGGESAEYGRRAAALRMENEPALAAALLREAADADPAAGAVHADLAEAARRIERWEESETAARRALDAAAGGAPLDANARIAVALVGASAARQRDRLAAAAEFYDAALTIDPACTDALAGAGECLAALEEWARAREPLASRLAHPVADPEAAHHHALLAHCHAEVGDAEDALAECEASLAIDSAHSAAHALCVSLHESAGRLGPGIAALERWAQHSDAAAAGEHLLRAAEWELSSEDRSEAAEIHLREATEAAPALAPAWRLLSELLSTTGRAAEAAETATAGLATHPDPETRAALWLVSAHALESGADGAAACKAYAAASEADPRCLEAALAEARLLRAAGDWQESADALERFVERHPGDDPVGLAEVHHQRARLLAGPLEDIDGAVATYQRAIALHPDRRELRLTLASLFSQRPGAWPEALEQYAATLETLPTDTKTLRAVLRIAEHTGHSDAVGNGLALLRALGVATPQESNAAPDRLELSLAPRLGLDSAPGEALRAAVQSAAEDIGRALGAPDHVAMPDADANSDARFLAAALSAQAELTAPGLLPLPTEEMADVVRCVALLSLDPESLHTSGATLNAISEAFGRRSRRRVQRALKELTREEIEAFDFTAWRHELRALAAARAVDSGAGDLRAALVAGICNAEDRSPSEFEPTRDIAVQVAACEEARGVMQRAVGAWLAQIAP